MSLVNNDELCVQNPTAALMISRFRSQAEISNSSSSILNGKFAGFSFYNYGLLTAGQGTSTSEHMTSLWALVTSDEYCQYFLDFIYKMINQPVGRMINK